mgnify:CR=1 FL=1
MKKANTIFKNAIVLTMNKDMEQFDRGCIVVENDSIIAVGFEEDLLASYEADEVIDCGGKS